MIRRTRYATSRAYDGAFRRPDEEGVHFGPLPPADTNLEWLNSDNSLRYGWVDHLGLWVSFQVFWIPIAERLVADGAYMQVFGVDTSTANTFPIPQPADKVLLARVTIQSHVNNHNQGSFVRITVDDKDNDFYLTDAAQVEANATWKSYRFIPLAQQGPGNSAVMSEVKAQWMGGTAMADSVAVLAFFNFCHEPLG